MKKKVLSITVVLILILLTLATVSEAKMSMSIKNSIKETPKNTNRVIDLGSATIQGDGTEGNSGVTVTVETLTKIEIEGDSEIVDLSISYSIQCTGDDDIGLLLFFAQLNAQSLGDNVVITTENEDATLLIEDVELTTGIFTWEIIPIYINTDPKFTASDLGFGTAGVVKKARNFFNILQSFPLIQSLLKLPRIAELITQTLVSY